MTLAQQSTVSYSACKECEECGKSCADCGCGTDCLGAILALFSPISTNYGAFSFSLYNQFKTNGASSATPDFGMGNNVLVQNWAYATENSAITSLVFTWGPNRALWFDSTTLASRLGARQILTHPSGIYRILDPDSGYIYEFNDFHGLLTKVILPGGNEIVNAVENQGTGNVPRITESTLTINYGTDQRAKEIWRYAYNDDARVTSVTLIRSTGTTTEQTETPLRRLVMTYYAADEQGGNEGNLKTVELQLRNGIAWQTIETTYFRYYTEVWDGSDTQPGYVNGVKFVVSPEAFARLTAATGNAFTAPDSVVAQFADAYYEYTDGTGGSNTKRVTLSTTEAGTHTHTFEYSTSLFASGVNNWRLKVVSNDENDGSQKITFANDWRQVMLTDTWASPGVEDDGRWITYTVYSGSSFRPTEQCTPASIDMVSSGLVYDEGVADLAVRRYPAQGLVRVTEYYGTSPAQGLVYRQLVREGVAGGGGSGGPVRSYTYDRHPASGDDYIVFPTSQTEYPVVGSGIGITTEFERTLIGSTLQTETLTTKLPQIPVSQNGQGDDPMTDPVYETVDTFDELGRRVSHMDELGSITEYSYDMPTGGMVQMIQDKPTSPGLNLITDYRVDELGRRIQELRPAFNSNGNVVRTASWTVYRDLRHEVWTANGFASSTDDGSEYTYTLVNPVTISRSDLAGREVEIIAAITPNTGGPLTGSETFPQATWVRLSTKAYDDEGDLIASRVYYKIPPTDGDQGVEGANYDETRYGYDRMGRQNMVRSPGGTITRTVYDVRNNPIAAFVGTEDTGATDDEPDGMGVAGNNMIQVSALYYDNNNPVGGNGLLTREVAFADSSLANERQTQFSYDWRDRLEKSSVYISATQNFVHSVNVRDNLDRIIQVDEYNPNVTPSGRIGQTKTHFDDLGRNYRTEVFGVTVGGMNSGDVTVGALTTDTWFDGKGRPIKRVSPGSRGYVKTAYDAADRIIVKLAGYVDASGDDTTYLWTPWPTGLVGADDLVFAQTETTYDGASHPTETIRYLRNQGEDDTGALAPADARVMYAAAWYDGIGRPIASANYGTNGGTPLDRPDSAPDSADDVLVSQIAYNVAGESFETTDPAGTVTRTEFDRAGRVVRTIQNYVEGGVLDGDTNVTTEIAYTPDGNVATLTAKNPATGDQVTRYLYGTTRAYTDENTVARSDLLVAEIYPDAADAGDQVTYTYNRLGDRVTMRDQNGTTHTYSYDNVGRVTVDVATIPSGSAVDDAVQRIELSYDIRGMVSQVVSRDGPLVTDAVVNQVTLTYDNWRALLTDVQQHGSSGTSALTVAYAYETDADTATKNSHRRISCTYPNSRVLVYGYGSANQDDDQLSRVASLTFDSVLVAQYAYFGLGSIASVTYPQTDVGISSVLASTNTYPGFDQFNRITSLPWTKSSEGDLAWLKYGYDQASNRVYRRDENARSFDPAKPFDELYTYDGMHRLHTATRGLLADGNASLESSTFGQTWQLDPTGNWDRFSGYDDQGASFSAFDQTRTQNAANEIIAFTPITGAGWPEPAFDRNGNMTAMPQPADPTNATPYTAIYDAWNRLTEIREDTTSIAANQYDGLTRRTKNVTNSGTTTRHYYYSDAWQVLEERVGTDPPNDDEDRQFVWGIRYIDDLVLRDRSDQGTLDERIYALQDANWNVVAVYDKSEAVQPLIQRFIYDAYGKSTVTDNDYARINDGIEWETRFTGQRLDLGTSLFLMRHRYYSPVVGRFVNRDDAGYVDGVNLYNAYFVPSHVDPSGLRASKVKCPPGWSEYSRPTDDPDVYTKWELKTRRVAGDPKQRYWSRSIVIREWIRADGLLDVQGNCDVPITVTVGSLVSESTEVSLGVLANVLGELLEITGVLSQSYEEGLTNAVSMTFPRSEDTGSVCYEYLGIPLVQRNTRLTQTSRGNRREYKRSYKIRGQTRTSTYLSFDMEKPEEGEKGEGLVQGSSAYTFSTPWDAVRGKARHIVYSRLGYLICRRRCECPTAVQSCGDCNNGTADSPSETNPTSTGGNCG